MQIRQLEYFVSLCETLNFTKTASEFFISQTAVTQQIKALEEELGTTLFNRTKRKVELTASGKILQEEAKAILDHLNKAKQHVQSLSGEISGTIRIGFIQSYEHEGLAYALKAFHSMYPKVQILLQRDSFANLNKSLWQGSLDLIFSHRYQNTPKGLSAVDIKTYGLMLVCPHGHPLSENPYVYPADLRGYPLVEVHKPAEDSEESIAVTQFYLNAGFLPEFSYLSDDVDSNLLAVAAGMGFALFPSYVTDHLADPAIVDVRPVLGHEKEMSVAAFWKEDNSNQLISRFIEIALLYLKR